MATTTTKKKPRKSGPSGQHNPDLKPKLIREFEPGQFDTWQEAADRAKISLMDWIRTRCDASAKAEKEAAKRKT